MNRLDEPTVEELMARIAALQAQNRQLTQRVVKLEEELALARLHRFAPRSEKRADRLFDEAEQVADEADAGGEDGEVVDLPDTGLPSVESTTGKKRGRRPLPENLPRERFEYDLADDQKACPCCRHQMHRMGETVTEQLHIEVKAKVLQNVRFKYACRNCDRTGINTPIVTAPMLAQPLPGSIATASTLAFALVHKYVDGTPLYRLAQTFERAGVPVSRGALGHWVIGASERHLHRIYDALKLRLRSQAIIHGDETTVQVLKEKDREATSTSFMWAYRSDKDSNEPIVLLDYQPGRGQVYPQAFLGDYQGILMSGGYTAWRTLNGATHLGCMAHSRRRFVDALKARKKGGGPPEQALKFFEQLYRIEGQAHNEKPDKGETQADCIRRFRQQHSVPILNALKAWLHDIAPKVLPDSKLGDAVSYTLNQWEYLARYPQDGRMPIDNNLLERDIRVFATGRKSWLFSDTVDGAKASAVGSSSKSVVNRVLASQLLSAVMQTKSKWSPGPGVRVLGVTLKDKENWVVSAAAKPIGICPDCGMRSRHRHGWHNRCLRDLPVQGQVVKIKLSLIRWQCRHGKCQRRTFTDRLPKIALPYAHRTMRMAEIVGLVGHTMGGRPAENLMHRLGMPISDDTILRQLKRNVGASRQDNDIRVVGIDDWSWRQSSHYGTIMVDLERRTVVDVLDDRSVESAKAWLQERPAIEVVSRDRCGLYARAAREGAAQARQVADRFHLVQNLRAAIKEQMSLSGYAHVRPILSEDAIASAAAQHRRASLAHRQSRQEIFEMLHALRQQGLTYSEIARRTGYERRSVANWLTSNTPRDRNRAALKPTSPLYFEAFLAECWKDGNRTGRHLFYDIKNRGYTGSRSNLERLLKTWRNAEKDRPDDISFEEHTPEPVRDPDTGHAISSVVAAALCIKPRGQLTDRQARKVDALKRGSAAFATMRSLAMRFNGILRSKKPEALDEWIDGAIDTELTAIMRFASVLRRDIDAVKNAIELPWSNGQAEGQINRLKTLKRAMYGRAGPELVRARMLPLNHRL